jgi:hypothetical protein
VTRKTGEQIVKPVTAEVMGFSFARGTLQVVNNGYESSTHDKFIKEDCQKEGFESISHDSATRHPGPIKPWPEICKLKKNNNNIG